MIDNRFLIVFVFMLGVLQIFAVKGCTDYSIAELNLEAIRLQRKCP